MERKVIQRAILIVPGVLFFSLAGIYENPDITRIVERLASTYVMVIVMFVSSSLIDSIDDIYRTKPISKIRPIKGLLQVVKIAVYIVIAIIIIATLLDQSPLILLSSVGALAAVFPLYLRTLYLAS